MRFRITACYNATVILMTPILMNLWPALKTYAMLPHQTTKVVERSVSFSIWRSWIPQASANASNVVKMNQPHLIVWFLSLFFFFWELSISYIYIYDSLILLAAQLSEIDEIQEQCVLECYNNYDDAYADEYVEEFMVCAQNSCDVSIPDNIGCRNTCYSDHMPAWDVRGLVNCFQSCEE